MSALLKEDHRPSSNIHARRIDTAHWAGVAADLRQILSKDDAFKQWEVEAIVESLMDIVKRSEPLTVTALKTRLHAKQFSNADAAAVASAIVEAYS